MSLPSTVPKQPKRSAASRAHLRDMVDQLFNCEVETLVGLAIERAKAGDSDLLRWIIQRAAPARRGAAIEIKGFRKIETAQDALGELARLVERVAAGELTVDEGSAVAELLRSYIQANDVADLARRLESVERELADSRG